jgi:hypothetical protein
MKTFKLFLYLCVSLFAFWGCSHMQSFVTDQLREPKIAIDEHSVLAIPDPGLYQNIEITSFDGKPIDDNNKIRKGEIVLIPPGEHKLTVYFLRERYTTIEGDYYVTYPAIGTVRSVTYYFKAGNYYGLFGTNRNTEASMQVFIVEEKDIVDQYKHLISETRTAIESLKQDVSISTQFDGKWINDGDNKYYTQFIFKGYHVNVYGPYGHIYGNRKFSFNKKSIKIMFSEGITDTFTYQLDGNALTLTGKLYGVSDEIATWKYIKADD